MKFNSVQEAIDYCRENLLIFDRPVTLYVQVPYIIFPTGEAFPVGDFVETGVRS